MTVLRGKIQLSICALLIIFLFCVTHKLSYAGSEPSEQRLLFRKGRILKTDGYKIYFSSIKLDKDSLIYRPQGLKEDEMIEIDKVIRVEIQKGSHTLDYGLTGGLVAATTSIIGLVIAEGISGVELDSDAKIKLIIVGTSVSALASMFFGSKIKKYETVYSNPKFEPKVDSKP